jgi:hypothetical protein
MLWFSLNDFYTRGEEHFTETQMRSLNKKIERDMEMYVDGPVRKRVTDAKESVAIWTAAY